MLNELSLTDLKALAYDLISQMEAAQNQLQIVNGEIANRLKNKQIEGSAITEKSADSTEITEDKA